MRPLINLLTASNAEQFALKINKIDNCTIFGQQSNGTIAYELVGVNYELPSGNYKTSHKLSNNPIRQLEALKKNF